MLGRGDDSNRASRKFTQPWPPRQLRLMIVLQTSSVTKSVIKVHHTLLKKVDERIAQGVTDLKMQARCRFTCSLRAILPGFIVDASAQEFQESTRDQSALGRAPWGPCHTAPASSVL